MKIIKISLITLLLNVPLLSAHESCDHTHRWWFNIASGLSQGLGDGDISSDGTAELSFNGMITDDLFVTLAGTGAGDLDGYETTSRAHEFSVLLGYKDKRPHWYWSAAAGVGALENKERVYVTNYYGNYYTSYNYIDSETNLSVPVGGQLFWTPFKHFGVGVIGRVSVSKHSLATAMLGIQFS